MNTRNMGLAVSWLAAGILYSATAVRPERTTVLLDLNGVLVDRVRRDRDAEPDPKADMHTGYTDVYLRPYARSYMLNARQNWACMGVWTAAMPKNARRMVDELRLPVDILLTQEHCVAVEREGTHPLFIKDPRKAGLDSVILVDDTLAKIRARDWWRAVVVEPWSHKGDTRVSLIDIDDLLRMHPLRKFVRNCMIWVALKSKKPNDKDI